MKKQYIENNPLFTIIPLTKDLADTYAESICQALDQIPLVEKHTKEQLLSESKGRRIFHNKWDHSLVALEGNSFTGVIIGYEREKEDGNQYPYNSIYVSDFAVAKDYQKKGLGKLLVEKWLEFNNEVGFITLLGNLRFSLQTNSASFNKHVQKLYESFGFKKIAEKKYDNRVDNVYLLEL